MAIDTNIETGTEVLLKARVTGKVRDYVRVVIDTDNSHSLPLEIYVEPSVIRGVVPSEPSPAIQRNLPEVNRNVIEAAIRNASEIQFNYRKPGQAAEHRYVEPAQLATSRSGDEFFSAFDVDENDYRTFRLDRIEGEVEWV